MKLSDKLKNLRIESGLTQKQLGERLGIGQATIAGYENGTREPYIYNLVAYAELFDCTVDDLLGRTDDFGVGVKSHKGIGVLNSEETTIIENYRGLSRDAKMKLLGYLDCLTKQHK